MPEKKWLTTGCDQRPYHAVKAKIDARWQQMLKVAGANCPSAIRQIKCLHNKIGCVAGIGRGSHTEIGKN